MPAFQRHLFVCTNERDPGHPRGCCNGAGAAIHARFKQAFAARGLRGAMRANKSGCLDQCEHGPTVVVYPEGIWYGFVTPDDVDEIVDAHLVGGVPVARLRLDEACINTARCGHKPRMAPVPDADCSTETCAAPDCDSCGTPTTDAER